MKKTFLKATLFSLMVSMVPAVITSCKDYDDDIKSLTTKDDQLQSEISDKLAQQEQALTNQIKALETALAEQKEAAATATAAAKAAADAAQAAADKAQQTADAAEKAAAEADAKAQAANAEAEAAKAAAAQAKADAIEEAKTMVEALRADITKQMADLDAKYGQKYEELAEAIGKAATKESLDAAVKSLTADIDALEKKFNASEAEIKEILADYLEKINKNTSDILAIYSKIEGIDTDINTLKTDLGKLESRMGAAEAKLVEQAAGIATNASNIAINASKITEITSETIPALKAELKEEINAVEATLTSQLNEYKQKVDTQLAALNLFMETYTDLLAGLQDKLDGIDTQLADLYVKYGEVAAELAQAKLEILKNADAIEDLEGVVAANKAELEGKIGQLSSQLTSAVETLNQKIDTVKEQLQQSIDGVQSNLENAVTDLQGKIDTINETLASIDETLGDHGSRITALEGTVEEQGQAIADLQADLQQAQRDIVKINGALSTLNAINAKRLTSVTLIPSAYVGGIPTIDFLSASFVPMVAGANGEYTAAPDGTAAKIVTNEETYAFYRLNPSGVELTDIKADDVNFVQMIASSRAGNDPAVVKVAKVEKEQNGVLKVYATKADNFTSDLNSAGEGKIYTVSLRVPIAEKNYYTWTDSEGNTVTEAAEDAVVYSEYTRVAEATFTPGIAAVYKYDNASMAYPTEAEPWSHVDNDPNYFFLTKTEALAEDAPVYLTVAYNQVDADLTKYVTAYSQKEATDNKKYLDNWADYGFSFTYEFVETDATKGYAVVTEDGKLTAANPEDVTNASRIGKVVTVRVNMKHGNDVVEQKYFNVLYTLTNNQDVVVNFDEDLYKHFQWNLYDNIETTFSTCLWADTKDGETVTAKGFISKYLDAVHAILNANDFEINQAEFTSIYSVNTIQKFYKDLTVADGDATSVASTCVSTDMDATAEWIVKDAAVKEDFFEVDGKAGKGIEIVVTFTPSVAGFPKVTLNLTGKVEWPTLLPVFGPVDEPRTWTIEGGKNQFGDNIDNFEETYKLAPMAYEVAVENNITRVNYKGNVLTGRVGNEETPYILNLNPLQGVYGAPVWDIRVCEENASKNPYNWMVEGSDKVAAVVWKDQNHTAYDLGYISNEGKGKLASDKPDYGYNSTVNFVVNENEAGRILVNSGKPVVLDWNVYLNGKEANNLYTVGHTNILIMQPITKVFFGEIEPIVQNFAKQSVEVAEYLRACDQYTTNETEDYLNGKGGAFDMSNEGKWNYYGFKNPQYSIVTEGLPSTELVYYTQMDIQIDETTGKLTFTTENVTLREPLVVTVNVTVDYAFGSRTAQTQVTISPNSISSHARKR